MTIVFPVRIDEGVLSRDNEEQVLMQFDCGTRIWRVIHGRTPVPLSQTASVPEEPSRRNGSSK